MLRDRASAEQDVEILGGFSTSSLGDLLSCVLSQKTNDSSD